MTRREQGVAALADGLDVLALLAGEFGIEEQAGHAEDAVHGGADFVADVGDEFGFEPRGLERADFADVGAEAGFARGVCVRCRSRLSSEMLRAARTQMTTMLERTMSEAAKPAS